MNLAQQADNRFQFTVFARQGLETIAITDDFRIGQQVLDFFKAFADFDKDAGVFPGSS